MGAAFETETAALARRFGENLTLLRCRSGLSQDKVATLAGTSVAHVFRLERGLLIPGLSMIVKVGCAIEVEPCELLTGMAWRLPSRVRRAGAYRVGDDSSIESTSRSC